MILIEVKKKLERLRDIGRQNPKIVISPIKEGEEKISSIEFLVNSQRANKVYINGYHSELLIFGEKKYWNKLYELANNRVIDFDKGFFDYFNSNKTNPLYKTHGYAITKILRKDKGMITPEIQIKIVTQKKVTQFK